MAAPASENGEKVTSFGFDDSYDPASHGFDVSHLMRPSRSGVGLELRVRYRRDDHVSPDAPAEYFNDDPDSKRLIEFLLALGAESMTVEHVASASSDAWHGFLSWMCEHNSVGGRLMIGEHPSVGIYLVFVGDPGMDYPGDSELLWISPEGLQTAARLSGATLRDGDERPGVAAAS